MRKLKVGLFGIFTFVLLAITAVACDIKSDTERSAEVQKDVQARANEAVPAYQVQDFTIREDINWHLKETEGRHEWYVYALNFTGEPIFYVVSDVRPTSGCVNLTAVEQRVSGSAGAVALTAPSLNGVYRKSGACSTFFMRDVTTGNLIEISGTTFTIIASKQPLFLETDLMRLGN